MEHARVSVKHTMFFSYVCACACYRSEALPTRFEMVINIDAHVAYRTAVGSAVFVRVTVLGGSLSLLHVRPVDEASVRKYYITHLSRVISPLVHLIKPVIA